MYASTHVVLARRALTLKYWQLLLLSNSSLHFKNGEWLFEWLHCLLDLTALPLSEPHRLPPNRAATSGPPFEPRCRLRASLRVALPPSLRGSLRAALPSPCAPPSEPRCRLRARLSPSRAAVSGPPSEPRCRPRASVRAALPPSPRPPGSGCRLLPASFPHSPRLSRSAGRTSPPLLYQVRCTILFSSIYKLLRVHKVNRWSKKAAYMPYL